MELDLDQLAASFVAQYYEGLLLQPRNLSACYGPDSTMCLSYCGGASMEAKGQSDIQQQMLNIASDFVPPKKMEILHVEIFPSFDSSALIIVDGVVLSAEGSTEFTHTVILRNNGTDGEYYIRNDVWRFSAPQTFTAAAPIETEQPVEEEVTEEAEEDDAAAAEQIASEEEDEVDEEAEEEVASEQQSETPSEADAEEATPVKEELKAEAKPSGPINWASKARSAAGAEAPKAPRQRVSPPPQRKEAVVEKKEDKPEEKKRKEKDQSVSYVTFKNCKNVEDDEVRMAIPETLRGSITSLRNMSSQHYCVFVDFSHPDALEILQSKGIKINGKAIPVEKQNKKTDARKK